MTREIITFGCRLNQYESEVIKKMLGDVNPDHKEIIVHTCAVTKEAEKQVKQKIRAIHKSDPDAKIIVIGCAVDLNSLEYEKLPGVIKVLKNKEKLHANNYTNTSVTIASNSIDHTPISKFENQTRAFVKIQDGCNNSCTFCSIKNTRGESRSLAIEDVLSRVALLIENGHREVVFTGVNITDFGADTESNLATLIRETLKAFPLLQRLRLSSIDVADISDSLIDVMISSERFMPHLHLSLQSGSNMILKRMRRRHSRELAIDLCNKIRRERNFTFGADLIAGFPTETDEMFNETAVMLSEIPITHAHVFPYSPRPNTPAAKMPQVEIGIRKRRASILNQIAKQNLERFCSQIIGTVQNVLVENSGGGHTENMVYVEHNSKINPGEVISLKITSFNGTNLIGEI